MDAFERDREANAVRPDDDYWPEEWLEEEAEVADEIAANRIAKQKVERALFVNGGLRNFLTVRREGVKHGS